MTTAAQTQIVTFRLADELFAADIFSVERVLRHEAPTPIPNVPGWIEGVIDYEGRVVPVIDLRRRLELPAGARGAGARILVFNVADEWVAATVDAVLDVSAVAADAISPPPTVVRGLAGEYVRGLVRRGDRLVIVLDAARLLSTADRVALDAAVPEPALAAAGAGTEGPGGA